jgi:predicted DCC family thiol-disulfide oxidoreductase YuxK
MLPNASLGPLVRAFPNILVAIDSPALLQVLIVLGAILSVFFVIGKWDKIAAIGMLYIWACLLGRNPSTSNSAILFVGLLLLAHVMIPGTPYGSLAAANRIDPGGDWKMPPFIFLAAWIIMAAGYSYSGYTKLVSPSWTDGTALMRVLQNPLARPGFVHDLLFMFPPILLKLATWVALALELLFAPLALFRATRPWIWLAMAILYLGLVLMINFADLTAGILMLHFFTFDPAWVPPLKDAERIFYDGHCGLCHRVVRFVLAEDITGTFRFAPLQSEAFQTILSKQKQTEIPDSVVVETSDGKLLFRSGAVLHIMRSLGGIWRISAAIGGVIPTSLLNAVYDFIARIRYRLFRRPADACPLMPPAIRTRFDL